jgi:hypothetical protein
MSRKTMALLVSITLVSALVLFVVRTGITSPTYERLPQSWPKFTMVYEQWGYGFGLNGAAGTQRVKYTYNGPQDWRVDVLSHSSVPEVAGSWAAYNGTEVRSFDPRVGKESVNNLTEMKGVHVPEEWLVPSYVPKLLRKPDVTTVNSSKAGAKELTYVEQLPCTEQSSTNDKAGISPCKSGTRTAQRQIVYREKDFIPLEIVDRVDSTVVAKITVESLDVE